MQHTLSSAIESETFSTPPSSPVDHNILDRPSLSRRGSRPTNLRIQQAASAQWTPDVVLDTQSPNGMSANSKIPTPSTAIPHINGNGKATANGGPHVASALSPLVAPTSAGAIKSPRPPHLQSQRQASPMRSPCFVHSQLQGPSFTEWLRAKHINATQEARVEGPKGGVASAIGASYPDGTISDGPLVQQDFELEVEESANSLTKQLAETAVGVREMSKQLGMLSPSRSFDHTKTHSLCRSNASALQHSVCAHRHEGAR